MTAPTTDQPFERLVRRFAPGAALLRAWEPGGGTSARVTALEIEYPGGRMQKVIVRRHGAVDLARNPHIAADEFKLLRFLYAAANAPLVPEPLYLDASCEIFPTPCIVMTHIEGGPMPAASDPADLIRRLAAQLAALHRIPDAPHALAFLPAQADNVSRKLTALSTSAPDDVSDEQRIPETLQAVWPLSPRNPPVLLHGDFWPGNTLWRAGQLAAVIDWEDAALGDPLGDLARSRLEILWAFGGGGMHDFTQRYLSLNPLDCADLPYWDLCAVLRQLSTLSGWGLDAATERAMRAGLRDFCAEAFEKISALRPPC